MTAWQQIVKHCNLATARAVQGYKRNRPAKKMAQEFRFSAARKAVFNGKK